MFASFYNLVETENKTKKEFCTITGCSRDYDLLDATNASKHFLIGQFVKFFLLIDQSNVLKYL